jgi:hypothetical protein
VHADLLFTAPDPGTAVDAVVDRACSVEMLEGEGDGTARVRDPDGHYLTFHAE